MNLGTGKAIITPPLGTSLAGYGHRDHGAEGVLDDLEVRAFWFEDGGSDGALCIITADLIGFDAALTAGVRDDLHRMQGIAPERVLLNASHTHSGPQTCHNMLGVGAPVPEVLAMVRQRILSAVSEARRTATAVTLCAGRGRCEGYAVNRRPLQDGKALFGPNPAGVRDDEVTVIACHDSVSGALRAAMFHYTCHPTTMGDYRITADYPGAARRHVEAALGGGAVAAFLQGCCGDVRPYCTFMGGKQFRRGEPEDVSAFGVALGDAVRAVLRGPLQTLAPALAGRKVTVELALAHYPERRQLVALLVSESPLQREWAEHLLARPVAMSYPIELQRIDLAQELTILALGGEVCCEYGHFVKALAGGDRFVIPLGYSNGITGYIPASHMFAEGGYEVEGSTPYFGLPSPFDPRIEADIHAGLRALM